MHQDRWAPLFLAHKTERENKTCVEQMELTETLAIAEEKNRRGKQRTENKTAQERERERERGSERRFQRFVNLELKNPNIR